MIVVVRSAFLSFYRSLTRHPLYAGLNLLGLSFGIAVFIVLSLFVRFETSYERWLPNADRIYVLGHTIDTAASATAPMSYFSAGYALDAVRQAYPNIEATRLYPVYMDVRRDDHVREEMGQLIDDNFFRFFDLPVITGDRQAALLAPDGIIVSERMALRYFGTTNAVGKALKIRDGYAMKSGDEVEKSWRVMAVLKTIPSTSNLNVDFVRSMAAFRARVGEPEYWFMWGRPQEARTFLVLPKGVAPNSLVPAIRARVLALPAPYPHAVDSDLGKVLKLSILPFTSEHLRDARSVQAVSVLRATAWLTLVVALINYVNLAVARTMARSTEARVRGIYGAGYRLLGQGIVEAGFAGLLSLGVAFSLVEVTLPLLNRLARLSLGLDYRRDGMTLLGLAAAVVTGSLMAGVYPATVMTRSVPVIIWRGIRKKDLASRPVVLREGMAALQFAVVGAFLIVLAGFAAQLRHMETEDLGFSRDNLLTTTSLIGTGGGTNGERIIAAWRKTPGIAAVGAGHVAGRYFAFPIFDVQRGVGGPRVPMAFYGATEGFLGVYRTPLIAGRQLTLADDVGRQNIDVREDVREYPATINVNIDLSATKAFGFATAQGAVGSDLIVGNATLHVVGIVGDQRFAPPTRRRIPAIYLASQLEYARNYVIVRFKGIDESIARGRLIDAWQKIAPDRPLDLKSVREELDYYYRDDRRNTRLFAVGGGAAALIGAVGLFGMAAFSTSARVHEIGIRKSVGATRWHIVRLLMFQFLRPVLVANLIAWPVAYLVLDAWLKQFDERVAMSPWFFLAGSGLSLLIAAVTVVGVAVSAASLSPARALRQL